MRARCNDIDVAWFEVGRGETLILIHGLGDDHRAWRRTLPDLMLNHRVVMYNLRVTAELPPAAVTARCSSLAATWSR